MITGEDILAFALVFVGTSVVVFGTMITIVEVAKAIHRWLKRESKS